MATREIAEWTATLRCSARSTPAGTRRARCRRTRSCARGGPETTRPCSPPATACPGTARSSPTPARRCPSTSTTTSASATPDTPRCVRRSPTASSSARLLTSGMEGFATTYRSAQRLEPISINFSVALSSGLMLNAGGLDPEFLSHSYLDANRDAIEAGAAKVSMSHDTEMDKAAPEGGVSVRSLLAAQTLAGQSFEDYVMAFPSEVTMHAGAEYVESQDVPLGGAGRPWAETAQLAREKFATNFPGDATEALAAIDALEDADDFRDVARLFVPR